MKAFLIHVVSFVLGSLAIAVPMFIRASMTHAEEAARHEQTMAPGITMFFGLLLAPVGGLLVMSLMLIARRIRKSLKDSNTMNRH